MHDGTPTTATFLFTDIEGSTKLLRTHRPEYARILSDHHRLLREAFGAHGGREIDNQGDSFFVAFARAKDAVLAAAASQRALAAHSWPGGALVRVRMGIHTGEADLTPDRYLGLSVHRAARISALGHGGQILVSPTTAGLLEDEDALPGLALRDLGEHWLKDIERPVRLYQLDVDRLQTNFPPLAVRRLAGVPQAARGRGRAGGRRRDHDGPRRCMPALTGQALQGLAARRPAGRPLDEVRLIRDELDKRIQASLRGARPTG